MLVTMRSKLDTRERRPTTVARPRAGRRRHARPTGIFAAFALLSMVADTTLAQQGGPPPVPAVTVAQPLAKRVTLWDEYSGRAEAVARVEVRARVSGYIDNVRFKDGALVKQGDPLFTIDKRPFELAVEAARAEVTRQQAQVQLATAEVERAEPLAKSRVMSEQVFDQRKANLSVAQATLLAAQASLKTAELNLEWCDVTAPIAGRISDKKVDAGNLVAGGQEGSTLLATIVTLDPIHFVFEVSEADYLRYSRLRLSGERPSSRDTASPVRIKLSDEDEWDHTGKMDFVDNELNERSGTLRGRAVFDNKDGLLTPGVFARLQLFAGETNAILIPDSAVVSDQARKIVFVVGKDNVVQPAQVTLGPIVEGLRLVRSGLKAEDRVVIEGIANPAVRPGAKIDPKPGEIKTASK
jgi:multidrug efflux system membrane fusion protein